MSVRWKRWLALAGGCWLLVLLGLLWARHAGWVSIGTLDLLGSAVLAPLVVIGGYIGAEWLLALRSESDE